MELRCASDILERRRSKEAAVTDDRPGTARPAALLVEELKACGISLIVRMPDSAITELWERVGDDAAFRTVQVSCEDEGIGICAGAYAGGLRAALLMANSGLMVSIYPLACLAMLYRLPVFMLIAHRGTPGDKAYFQEYQGLTTEPLLDAVGVTNHPTLRRVEDVALVRATFEYAWYYKRPTAVLLNGAFLDASGHNYTVAAQGRGQPAPLGLPQSRGAS
jgi:sulfopyruvate decarboxylase subunit alpha